MTLKNIDFNMALLKNIIFKIQVKQMSHFDRLFLECMAQHEAIRNKLQNTMKIWLSKILNTIDDIFVINHVYVSWNLNYGCKESY